MKVTARQIATIINGVITGDPETSVSGFAKIEDAGEGTLTFLANAKYIQYLDQTRASVIIISRDFFMDTPREGITYIIVPDAYAAFTKLLQAYQQLISQGKKKTGKHPQALVEDTATLHESVYIGPLAYLGNNVSVGEHTEIGAQCFIGDDVRIGRNCILHPGVKIMEHCIIGDNVVLHPGVIIGSDGFGFAPDKEGVYSKVPQLGNVVISDNVEIGANTTIDRATMGSTVIGKGVKIDNLVQIAHNVIVGDHTVIAAQAGISGSTKIGKHCIIGGQAGIVGHITLADGTKINAQSGVAKTVTKPHSALTGSPAHDYYSSIKSQALVRQLPFIVKRIEILEQNKK